MFFSQAIGNVTTNFLGIIITVSFNGKVDLLPRPLLSLSLSLGLRLHSAESPVIYCPKFCYPGKFSSFLAKDYVNMQRP
jgi:hypothetical protein